MSDDPPKLTIAAQQSEAELRKQRALDDLHWPTREMAANLLRVTRGAGRPSALPQQIINLAEAILEAAKVSNAWGIWSVMEEVLQSGMPDDRSGLRGSEETITRGALQLVASNLAHQSAQAAAGEREIDDGISMVERERERNRARWKAEAEAAKAAIRVVRRELKEPKKTSTAEFMKKRKRELDLQR